MSLYWNCSEGLDEAEVEARMASEAFRQGMERALARVQPDEVALEAMVAEEPPKPH